MYIELISGHPKFNRTLIMPGKGGIGLANNNTLLYYYGTAKKTDHIKASTLRHVHREARSRKIGGQR